ncbi:hypothetical protein NE174_16760 [Clostridium botulinum]|nr:hypothetical protein [Clostridium botulinum]MCR1140343.1 hypothetical protein [Clostridium botulinum]
MKRLDTKNISTNITKILVGLNLIIYLFILNIDFLKIKNLYKYSTNIKFVSIVICFVITLFIGKNIYDKKDLFILRLALFFTVLADFNMLILEKFKLGILFFIIVQSLYIIRHGRFKDVNGKVRFKYRDIYMFVFCLFLFIILKRLNLFSKESTLLSMAFIYALLLIHSLIRAYETFNNNFFEKKTCKIISIGITLFFLCDLNVAFSNISFYLLSIKHVENLENVFLPLIWFFYLPSQILLSLSGEK